MMNENSTNRQAIRQRRLRSVSWIGALVFPILLFLPGVAKSQNSVDAPYLAFQYDRNMNFGVSVVRDPAGKPVRKQLTYSVNGFTNSVVVKIDGKELPFTSAGGKWIKKGENTPRGSVSVWRSGDIEIVQILKLRRGELGRLNTLLIRYELFNTGKRSHRVAVRAMIDSAIGSPNNDNVPFRYSSSSELISTFKHFPKGTVPEWMEALENGNVRNPGTIAHLTLKWGEGLQAPTQAAVTYWPGHRYYNWAVPLKTINPNRGRKDSCLVLYWHEDDLGPKCKRRLAYAYGTKVRPSVSQNLDEPLPKKGMLRVTRKGILPRKLMPAVLFVYDSSGSMQKLVENRPKYVVARQVMQRLLKELPANMQAGLRLFGHGGGWRPSNGVVSKYDPRLNTDSQLAVPVVPLTTTHRMNIQQQLAIAMPWGRTPLVYSLLQTLKDFPTDVRAQKTVVLISDGLETCGGKLADVAAAYRGAGIHVRINVVGFDIRNTEAERQLKQIAAIGKGKYYGANNAEELAKALRSAVPSATYAVYDSENKHMGQGRINGPALKLRPGRYSVRLQVGNASANVEIKETVTVNLNLDDNGRLVILSAAS